MASLSRYARLMPIPHDDTANLHPLITALRIDLAAEIADGSWQGSNLGGAKSTVETLG